MTDDGETQTCPQVLTCPRVEVLRGRDGRDGRDGGKGEKGDEGPKGERPSKVQLRMWFVQLQDQMYLTFTSAHVGGLSHA